MTFQIERLKHHDLNDFIQLLKVFETVFEWENYKSPSKDHLSRILEKSTFIAIVGKTGNEVIGGLTAHILDRYDSEKPSAYLYDLAVDTSLQRQGIGKKLVAELIEYCRKKGFSEVFVQAESIDQHAIDFYRQTPLNEELQANHFVCTL